MNQSGKNRSHRVLVVAGNGSGDELRELFGGGDLRSAGALPLDFEFVANADTARDDVAASMRSGRRFAVAVIDVYQTPAAEILETLQQIWQADSGIFVALARNADARAQNEVLNSLGGCGRITFLQEPYGNIRQLILGLVARFQSEHTDPLTGIMNRRSGGQLLAELWNHGAHGPQPLSCVLADVDYFKQVNTRHGHQSGDEVLAALSDLLENLLGQDGFVSRHASDEFCILLPGMNQQHATEWAERARTALAEQPIYLTDGALSVTASFGIAQRQADMACPDDLICRADEALGVAKQSGRDRVVSHASLFAGGPGDLTSIPATAVARMLARDLMTSPIVTLHEKSPVSAAVRFFLLSRIQSSPIVDDQGMLVGIVSEKDVTQIVAADDSWNTPLGDIMQPHVVAFGEETPVSEILQFFSRVSLQRVVIVRGGRPTGVLSRGNLLRWFENNFAVREPTVDAQAEQWHNTALRSHLTQVCEGLLEHSEQLLSHLVDDSGDLTAPIVDHASRMQESLTDLLALSRVSSRSGMAAGAMHFSR